ncbi:MAG: hypothetical protein P1U40_14125 [Coxiellaceae bacterium]|nr:hypothetical protein [Coxiellaceae bacterium]
MARRSRAIRKQRARLAETQRLAQQLREAERLAAITPAQRRAGWMDQADRATRVQRLANPSERPTAEQPVSENSNTTYNPTPASNPVGAVLDVGTRLGMGAFLASLASKDAVNYLMKPYGPTSHTVPTHYVPPAHHAVPTHYVPPAHHAVPTHYVGPSHHSAPVQHFTAAHFAAFSYVGVMTMAGLAYTVRQTAKSPNVNRHQMTNLAIQTGVATTIGTTVFGGFAKKALAAGGPIAFFAINAVMFAKSAWSAMQNHWHARKLRINGKTNSKAYKTYIAKRNQHAKAAGLHAIGAIGTGILITFAPVIAVGWTIATAAVTALAQVIPVIGRFFSQKKKPAQQQTNGVTNNTDHPREHVMQGARMTNSIEIRHVSREQKTHTAAVKHWSDHHEKSHREAGVRSYDLRHHYRHALFHPVSDTVTSAAQPQPRNPTVMKARMLGVLQHAIDKANADLAKDPSVLKEGMLQRKLKLATSLYHSVREDLVTVDGVHQAVKANKGNMFQLSALSSFRRRVGHMQSVVESVEYYAAWLDSYQHGKSEIDHSKLRYQHDDGYLVEAKCLQKHQPHSEADTTNTQDDDTEEQHFTPRMA